MAGWDDLEGSEEFEPDQKGVDLNLMFARTFVPGIGMRRSRSSHLLRRARI